MVVPQHVKMLPGIPLIAHYILLMVLLIPLSSSFTVPIFFSSIADDLYPSKLKQLVIDDFILNTIGALIGT